MDIPGYKIERPLGKGGMATVFLAIQEKFDREVALKVMSPALSADPSFCERFMREAKIVAKISHPNIVAVYDVNEHNGLYYIAMEYHPGGDLKARIRSGLSVKESLQVTREVAKALDYAHGKGYIHRDIKPDNVLFRADGSAVLTDFGIARAIEGDAGLTQMGTVAGTPKYMSPEQARGQALDGDSDLYSLGVMLYEMLTGSVPYEATDPIALGIMHLNSPIPRLEGPLAHFQPLLDRLLAKNAAQRPQSGAALIREVDALESSFDYSLLNNADAASEATVFRPAMAGTASARPAGGGTVRAPEAGSKKGVVVAGAVVLALAGGGVVWWQNKGGAPAPAAATSESPSLPVTPAKRDVGELLSKARTQIASGALLEPAGDNALETYRSALAMDVDNAEAKSGLDTIASRLQDRGFDAVRAGSLPEAEEWAAKAAEVSPSHPGNQELQKAIARAKAASVRDVAKEPARQAERKPVASVEPKPAPVASDPKADMLKRLRVQGLISGGNAALEDNNPSLAQEKFRSALALDPSSAEAREGLRKASGK